MKQPPTPEHVRKCGKYSKQLIGPLRAVARSKGYALAVHGSLKRDIDLIACPWSTEAVDAKELAEALRVEAERIIGYAQHHEGEREEWFLNGCQPFGKPHGVYRWCFHLQPDYAGPYIDLAVVPRESDEVRTAKEQAHLARLRDMPVADEEPRKTTPDRFHLVYAGEPQTDVERTTDGTGEGRGLPLV